MTNAELTLKNEIARAADATSTDVVDNATDTLDSSDLAEDEFIDTDSTTSSNSISQKREEAGYDLFLAQRNQKITPLTTTIPFWAHKERLDKFVMSWLKNETRIDTVRRDKTAKNEVENDSNHRETSRNNNFNVAAISDTKADQDLKISTDNLQSTLDPSALDHWRDTSRVRVQGWIRDGLVSLDGEPVTDIKHAVKGGQQLVVTPQHSDILLSFVAEPVAFEILYEDDDVLVVNKPAGLVVHPAAGNWQGTLLNGLLHRYPALAYLARAGLVHRLDKLTSGLMVVAKNLSSQNHLILQLQSRVMKRQYLAMVWGQPNNAGQVAEPMGRHPSARTKMAVIGNGKPALTFYKVLARQNEDEEILAAHPAGCALLRCDLATGRTHQIRVHLEHIGHPLLGDPVYFGRSRSRQAILPRQALHAWRLGFVHPRTHENLTFKVDVPEDFYALAERLDLAHGLPSHD